MYAKSLRVIFGIDAPPFFDAFSADASSEIVTLFLLMMAASRFVGSQSNR